MKYKVREQFFVHMDGQVFEPGTELDLNDEQAALHAVQIEAVEPAKPSGKAKGQ